MGGRLTVTGLRRRSMATADGLSLSASLNLNPRINGLLQVWLSPTLPSPATASLRERACAAFEPKAPFRVVTEMWVMTRADD